MAIVDRRAAADRARHMNKDTLGHLDRFADRGCGRA